MELDYSKLSTKELEAIANNDYSKLSTRTLEALAAKPPEKSVTDYAKDLGKSFVSLADTGINAATGLLDYGAYALARGAGLSPEQAQKETSSPKDYLGRAFGIENDPAYQQELSRKITQGIGNFVGENVVQPVAQATGIPEQDVANMTQSIGMLGGPAMGRAGQAVGRAAYAAEPYITQAPGAIARAPGQFLKGAYEGVTNPVYREGQSAMIPLREQYTPVPAAERFMGQMPGVPQQTLEQLQSQARPTSELLTNPIDKFAKATAPVSPEGYPLVPAKGRGVEAFGERVGRGIRTNPGQAMLEAGVTALTGVPVKTISQGISELAARHLAGRTGFSPEFPQQVQAAQGRAGIQAGMPTQQALPYNPRVSGPVNPQTMYAGTTGQVGPSPQAVQQAELAQKYAPQPVAPTGTPKQISQEVAASKIQPSPEQQAILDQIRARGNKPAQVAPVAPEGVPEVPSERWTPQERLTLAQQLEKLKKEPQKEMTPAEEAQMKKDIKQVEMSPAQRGMIIKEWVDGKRVVEGEVLDLSKGAYGASNNRTTNIAKSLAKLGIDEIPKIQGASSTQVIDAMWQYINEKKPDMLKPKRGPKKKDNVSQMLTEDTSSGSTYTSKHRINKEQDSEVFGSKNDPLTNKEYDAQQMMRNLQGSDISETSVWYKDKNGNTNNHYSNKWGELNVEVHPKDTPGKSTTYSRSEFQDREGSWVWSKTEWSNGSQVKKEYLTKDGKYTSQLSKDNIVDSSWKPKDINSWPAAFGKIQD